MFQKREAIISLLQTSTIPCNHVIKLAHTSMWMWVPHFCHVVVFTDSAGIWKCASQKVQFANTIRFDTTLEVTTSHMFSWLGFVIYTFCVASMHLISMQHWIHSMRIQGEIHKTRDACRLLVSSSTVVTLLHFICAIRMQKVVDTICVMFVCNPMNGENTDR